MDVVWEKTKQKKRKRVRKNKKWIPYKELTPEERNLLKQERDRKRLRQQLLNTRIAINAAEKSGDYSLLTHAPPVTNEDYEFVSIPPKTGSDENVIYSSEEEDEFIKSYEMSGKDDYSFDGSDHPMGAKLSNEEFVESIESVVRRQQYEIENLERENEELENTLRELSMMDHRSSSL